MLLLRKILFYLFVLVYCVSCPILVLYALGYILRPGIEHGITKAGLIYLSTLPSGAAVRVENKRFAEKTPTTLRGLLPGDYRVAVSLKGYRPWTRTIAVQVEKASVFDKILLLPKEPRYEKLSAEEFDDLIPTRSSRFLLLTKGPLLEDLFFYDLKNETLSPVIPGNFSFKGARLVSYSSAEEGENLLVHAQFGLWWGEEKFFWISPAHKTKIRDVTHLFHEKLQLVDWDNQRPEQLFALTDGVLSHLDTVSGAVYPKFLEKVRAVGLSDKKLYVVDENSGFQKMDLAGKSREKLEEGPSWTKAFFSDKDIFKIKILPKDKALFIGRRGRILSSEPPYLLADEGIVGVESDLQSRRVLFWSDDKLGVLDFSDEAENTIRWLIDKGKKITQAFWVYEGSHVLFRDGNKVYLLELAAGMAPQLEECLEVKRGSSILYVEKPGKIYYLEKNTGKLCVTEFARKNNGF